MAEVYLLHASAAIGNPDSPYGMAQHYLGCAEFIAKRVQTQRKGFGASLTRAFVEQGISLQLARVWTGGFPVEQRLKRYKNSPRLCPICCPGDAWNRGDFQPRKKKKKKRGKTEEELESYEFEGLLRDSEIEELRRKLSCHYAKTHYRTDLDRNRARSRHIPSGHARPDRR